MPQYRPELNGFLFASSGGTVYGDQQVFPADESHPTEPISPYGVAKLSVEKYLGYFRYQHGVENCRPQVHEYLWTSAKLSW